jgi:putative membrane protein (TIGR04086 family)
VNECGLDPKAIAIGALVAAVITVPVSLLAPENRDSTLNLILYVIIIAGLVLGGFAAGRQAPDFALSNGALAPLVMFLVVQGFGVIRNLASGDRVNVFAIIFNALLATSCGAVGGAIANRARSRPAGKEEPT